MSIVPSLLFGCGGKGKEVKKIEGDPETFYQQGLVRFNKRDYSEALKKFEELKSNFPDSPPFTIWAELKVGDCHFLKEEYVEAIAAYEEFKKIHPSHEEIPYVQFQIGMSYYNQMLALDRDQTATKKALSNFEYLIVNYPPNLFTDKAKEKIGVCKQRLADHEFYIGNYYYKRGGFEAAASRFEGLLEKFPKSPEEDKTLYLLGRSYLELDQWQKAEWVFIRIVSEYPKSSHSKEAKAILEKGVTGTKASLRNTKTKESKKKGEMAETEPEAFPVKFEEEGRQPLSFKEEKKVFSPSPSAETALKIEVKPDEEKRAAALPNSLASSGEKKKVKKSHLETKEDRWVDTVDRGQPIDITSDKVEAYWKENLIIFKGNVIARQKDIVIYADSIEAVIVEDGK
jgi:outer membrane protein assembly factor BamD